MICLMTERRLAPGAYDDFRRAWQPTDDTPFAVRAYHLRDLSDPDHVISFGLVNIDREQFERLRATPELASRQRARFEAMEPYVRHTGVDAVFEVAEVVEMPGAPGGG